MRSKILTNSLILGAVLAFCGCGPSIPDPQPMPAGVSFAGLWYSNWGRMKLQQKGTHVHGVYKGYRIGSLSGDLEGNLLKFKWTQVAPRMWGRGYMRINSDGSVLEGRWGYQKNTFNGGAWRATKN